MGEGGETKALERAGDEVGRAKHRACVSSALASARTSVWDVETSAPSKGEVVMFGSRLSRVERGNGAVESFVGNPPRRGWEREGISIFARPFRRAPLPSAPPVHLARRVTRAPALPPPFPSPTTTNSGVAPPRLAVLPSTAQCRHSRARRSTRRARASNFPSIVRRGLEAREKHRRFGTAERRGDGSERARSGRGVGAVRVRDGDGVWRHSSLRACGGRMGRVAEGGRGVGNGRGFRCFVLRIFVVLSLHLSLRLFFSLLPSVMERCFGSLKEFACIGRGANAVL